MKKAFLSSLIIVALFTSCNKNNNAKPVPVSTVAPVSASDLAGKWQPVSVTGLNGEPKAMSDISWHYIFNENSTYVDYFSSQSQRNGAFQMGQAKSITDGQIHPAISFDGASSQSIVVIKNDTLTISDNFVGGSRFFFVRFN
ncbi:MAG: lipocalin family protein [Sphingobacteriales bacterium]